MSNLIIRLKYFFKSIKGLPKTEAIESEDQALRKELADFTEFSQSNDLKHFEELKTWFETKEYQKVKAELKALTYKSSPEYQIEKEFLAISKDKALKNYLSVSETETPAKFIELEKSGLPENFAELESFVKSTEYKQGRKQFKKDNTEEYQKELAYIELKQNQDLKEYQRLKKWKPLQDYFKIKDSEVLKKYLTLKEKVESQDFKERKAYLLSTDKFEKTETYKNLQEYQSLVKSEKIQWYFSCLKKDKFKELKRWELSFSDDFSNKKLDPNKWITRYFWGEALINSSYSLASDNQWYSDGKNIEIANGTLKIKTVKEEADGISWDARYGFIPKKFSYTSGLICTGSSFRQKHGRFEAKVKVNPAQGVYHAFWLVGDKMLPQIDVLRKKDVSNNSIQGAFFWEKPSGGKAGKRLTQAGGLDLANFYILGVDWDENQVIWKVNGVPFKVEKNNLPQGSVYMIFSSGVNGQTDDSKLPVTFEIDWVRCWTEIKH